MKITKLSIIIPVYNEKHTIEKIIKRVQKTNLGHIKKEIIIIDDGSSDGTKEILKKLNKKNRFKIYFQKRNSGKGLALRRGFGEATGDVVVTQDADLEYNPNDLIKLLRVMKKENAQVVYGSRLLNKKRRMQHAGYLYFYGGRLINFLVNFLYGAKITDEATGHKLFNKKLLLSIPLNCKRFDFCPEITAKILKKKIKIYEVGISYKGRSVAKGKKVRLKDGLEAIWTLLKYRFID